MITVTKTYLGMKATINHGMTDRERELFQYALASYGFVLPYRESHTGAQWADYIRKTYSMDEPRNAVVVNLIERLDE